MIEGRVAAILNDYQVVMNKGYNDGVRKNMEFVLYELGDEIKDPSTGEVLDREMKVKHKLRILHVQGRITTLGSADLGWLGGFRRLVVRVGDLICGWESI